MKRNSEVDDTDVEHLVRRRGDLPRTLHSAKTGSIEGRSAEWEREVVKLDEAL